MRPASALEAVQKRSKHADFLALWRTYLYGTLLGSPALVRSVFEAFGNLPQLGMVAPQHFEPVRRCARYSISVSPSSNDFPEEAGQVDDTPAHGIERLYFHVVEHAGYTWMKIADSALLFDTRAVVRIGNPEDLARFAAEHGANLASGSLAKRAEVPPMTVQTPTDLLRRLSETISSAPMGPEQTREAA